MPFDCASLQSPKNLIADADLISKPGRSSPENRTGVCRENLRAVLAPVDDFHQAAAHDAGRRAWQQGRRLNVTQVRDGSLPAHGSRTKDARWRETAKRLLITMGTTS
jgi:hypothetical protein